MTIGHEVSSIVESEDVSDCMDIELEVSFESWSGILVEKYRLLSEEFGISEESDISEEYDMLVEFKSEFDESFEERTTCFLFFEFKV